MGHFFFNLETNVKLRKNLQVTFFQTTMTSAIIQLPQIMEWRTFLLQKFQTLFVILQYHWSAWLAGVNAKKDTRSIGTEPGVLKLLGMAYIQTVKKTFSVGKVCWEECQNVMWL